LQEVIVGERALVVAKERVVVRVGAIAATRVVAVT
jgi:hypothetical protein